MMDGWMDGLKEKDPLWSGVGIYKIDVWRDQNHKKKTLG
jgi:hypothetical protein